MLMYLLVLLTIVQNKIQREKLKWRNKLFFQHRQTLPEYIFSAKKSAITKEHDLIENLIGRYIVQFVTTICTRS